MNQLDQAAEEKLLREALKLIKRHISDRGAQSYDLHIAVQKIVDVARNHGLLLEHGAR